MENDFQQEIIASIRKFLSFSWMLNKYFSDYRRVFNVSWSRPTKLIYRLLQSVIQWEIEGRRGIGKVLSMKNWVRIVSFSFICASYDRDNMFKLDATKNLRNMYWNASICKSSYILHWIAVVWYNLIVSI